MMSRNIQAARDWALCRPAPRAGQAGGSCSYYAGRLVAALCHRRIAAAAKRRAWLHFFRQMPLLPCLGAASGPGVPVCGCLRGCYLPHGHRLNLRDFSVSAHKAVGSRASSVSGV